MLTINQNPTEYDLKLLGAIAKAAAPKELDIDQSSIQWHVTMVNLTNSSIPIIIGLNTANNTTVTLKAAMDNGTVRLDWAVVDSPKLETPAQYQLSPLNEIAVMSALDAEPQQEQPRTALATKMDFMKELYSDDDDYSIDLPVPKVFFTELDMEFYMSKLTKTLEESILLWMECSGRLSVDMDDPDILFQHLLKKDIKRIYMHGTARNQVRVELHDGTAREFSSLNPSIQVEICREILSII